MKHKKATSGSVNLKNKKGEIDNSGKNLDKTIDSVEEEDLF